MNYEYKTSLLSRAVLGAVFTGIFVSAVNMAFDYIYRSITQYSFSEVINFPSLIIFSMLSLLAAGVIYFLVIKFLSNSVVYTLFFVALTIALLFVHLGKTMPNGVALPASAHGLTMGIFIITGLASAFVVPYMANHSKIWS